MSCGIDNTMWNICTCLEIGITTFSKQVTIYFQVLKFEYCEIFKGEILYQSIFMALVDSFLIIGGRKLEYI